MVRIGCCRVRASQEWINIHIATSRISLFADNQLGVLGGGIKDYPHVRDACCVCECCGAGGDAEGDGVLYKWQSALDRGAGDEFGAAAAVFVHGIFRLAIKGGGRMGQEVVFHDRCLSRALYDH